MGAMRFALIVVLLLSLGGAAGVVQRPEPIKTPEQSVGRPPRQQKVQQEEIRKLSARLLDLSNEVDADIVKSGTNVLALGTLKKLEEIEKTARRLRDMLKQ
jgi:hypothetical protein